MCSVWPCCAPAMASGSRRPTWEPASRSASWQVRASASGSSLWPSASNRATENAALDDRPAPTGSELVTRMAPPELGRWTRRSAEARCECAATTPQATVPNVSSAISSGSSGNWSDSMPTRKLPGFGVNVTSVAKSMAIGSESPSL